LSEIVELRVPDDAAGKRLDAFLAKEPRLHGGRVYLSRSRIQHLIEAAAILVDGRHADKSMKLKGGESIRVDIPDPESTDDIPPEKLPIEVIYDDSDIVVVNKPAGMVTHPTSEMRTGTVVNALKGLNIKLPGKLYPYRPGIIHRLDKKTSGLMVVAKTVQSYLVLIEMMKNREIQRQYRMLTIGNLPEREGRFDGDIGRHPTDRKKMAVVAKGGKKAITLYTVLERYPGLDFAQARLLTGRTHQIRVHVSNSGRAVFGDQVYGGQAITPVVSSALERIGATPVEKAKWKKTVAKLDVTKAESPGHMLHAFKLTFKHPLKGDSLEFEAELPDYFNDALSILRKIGEVTLEP
jgi:23S rRNA pseudouridine1911/1915/1917 synthase